MNNSVLKDANVSEIAKANSGSIEDQTLANFGIHIEQFNKKMEYIERLCNEPDADKDVLLTSTVNTLAEMTSLCERFEKVFAHDQKMIKEAQKIFREKTDHIFSKSYFANHARTWPLGYVGDHKMLEYTYQNAPRSTGIGYYIDRTFLNQTLAVAVRGRLETLGNLLRTELNRRSQPKLLNVACGSCRELFDVAPAFVNSGASAICIDFDHQALTYAANKLAYSSINPDKMKFQRYNAIKMINHDRNVKEFGYQDIIYSTGFFDYVSDDVLVRLLKAAMSLLNPDGKLIASFKDCRQYKTQEYHWLVNWDAFFQRTEEDMDRLLEKAEISRSNIQTVREHSGVIKFYIVTK